MQIEEMGIETAEDFIGLTPNVFIANTFTVGSSLVMSRGVAQTHNGDSPLAIVVDGVYQGNQKQLVQEFFDIERIEILKGPEGALYGRNSIGGALNIITRQPTEEWEGYVRASAGTGSTFGTSFAVGGPIHEDDLLFRVSAGIKDSDGFIDNVFLGERVDPYRDTTYRLQLKWRPVDRLSLSIRGAFANTTGGAGAYAIFPTTGFASTTVQPESNLLGESERDMQDYTIQAEWLGDDVTLTAITGISQLTEAYRSDLDFTFPGSSIGTPLGQLGQGQDLDVTLISQEVRVASSQDTRWRWLAGIYVLGTDRTLTTNIFIDTDGTLDGLFPILTLAEDNDNTAAAAFGQLDFRATDKLSLSASLRYDNDDRSQIDLATGARRKTSFDAWQPRFTASYMTRADLMAYVNVGRGFRSGGYNAPSVRPDVFRKEIADNVELGVRSSLFGDRLLADGAVFFSWLDNAQYFQLDFASASQSILNMNDVRIRGAELSLMSRPLQGLEVYAQLGLIDSAIEDFDGTDAFSGNQTPLNVTSMLNLGAQYAYPLNNSFVGIGRLDLERRGKQYWHPDNLDVQDPITLLNLRFTVTTGIWSVTAWGRNVTNQGYYVEYGDASWVGVVSGDDIGWLGRPRRLGLDISRRF